MKKAVIECGGVQHLVAKGDIITVNSLGEEETVTFTPVMLVDGKDSVVAGDVLSKAKVSGKVIESGKGDKVTAIRYKAKKRVHKRRGHRQHLSKVEITSIA